VEECNKSVELIVCRREAGGADQFANCGVAH
jgi:hypothetical protein